jgi:hypothetical protein
LALRPGTFALLVAFAGLVAVWRGRRWGRWPILAGLGFYFALLLLPLHIWVQMPLEDRFPRRRLRRRGWTASWCWAARWSRT